MNSWDDLTFWSAGEWDAVQERLDERASDGAIINPSRENMFNALDLTPYKTTKVIIMGQDPYPDHLLCTGSAFSIPRGEQFPPTLTNIFREYEGDLRLPWPPHGNLESWQKQGVLLWNCLPTCEHGKSLAHDWDEYHLLSQQIIEASNELDCVVALVGGVARQHNKEVFENPLIEVSHPSPRGMLSSKNPFIGSRFFSSINDALRQIGQEPINWRIV